MCHRKPSSWARRAPVIAASNTNAWNSDRRSRDVGEQGAELGGRRWVELGVGDDDAVGVLVRGCPRSIPSAAPARTPSAARHGRRASVPDDSGPPRCRRGAKRRVDGVDHCRGDFADGELTEVRVEIAVEHGAGLADRGRRPRHRAIANHASKQLADVERTPTARSARTAATMSASSSFGLGTVAADRHRPVATPVRVGSMPMKTRSSNEPALRWRIEPSTTGHRQIPPNIDGQSDGHDGQPAADRRRPQHP